MAEPETYYRVFINIGSITKWIPSVRADLQHVIGELGLLMITDYGEPEAAIREARRAGLHDGEFVIVPVLGPQTQG